MKVSFTSGFRFLFLLLFSTTGLVVSRSLAAETFVRGQVNGDGAVDMADAIDLLHYLFLSGPAPGCRKAADLNDDGDIDIADPVRLLLFLFTGGPAIPQPYPDRGLDPTTDALSCDSGAPASHADIASYDGPATCIACHRTQAEAIHASVHYQLSGPTPDVPNIPGAAGKAGSGDLGFNSFCGTPSSSPWTACSGCHIGNGMRPSPEAAEEQLANIDCLMCHQDAYRRKPAGPFQDAAAIGQDGKERTIQVPVENEKGFQYAPDEGKMEVSILEAARTIHRPGRASCLRCHAYAGGSDGSKRGDLSSASANPPQSADVHMSPAGLNFACQECHRFQSHRVLGRGLDLRPSDRPEKLSCTLCHPQKPHGYTNLNNHTARVACQTCHIPSYARDPGTETGRDWSVPVYSSAVLNGQGGWKPQGLAAAT